MIEYTAKALRQVDALLLYYQERQRGGAARALMDALTEAEHRIERSPAGGLPAPRSYPRLARPNRAWIKVGRYWVHYSTERPPVIIGIYFETANIPGRL